MNYLMENNEEAIRLEMKTDAETVRKQAEWCGIKPGMRVLDVGCGPGITTSILHEMIQPGGSIIGIDSSEDRIEYAKKYYGEKDGIAFYHCDLRNPPDDIGEFDALWVRFVLEYFRAEGSDIVKHLKELVKKGGYLCLLDLDYNCLSHYEITAEMEDVIRNLMKILDDVYNFDTFAGRKLHSYLYDNEFENIEVDVMAHSMIYGSISDVAMFNWVKKAEMIASLELYDLFSDYSGGYDKFLADFKEYLVDPRRFYYSPLILCKGMKPVSR
jgi:ubiquinone/menaquinone biosynthesis C-methylase UbiE